MITIMPIGQMAKKVKNWWHKLTNQQVFLSSRDIIYGIYNQYKTRRLSNFSILVAKHVYKCFLEEEQLIFQKYKLMLGEKIVIEKTIALGKNRLTAFYIEWKPLLSLIQ